jgi:predicted DNA-binding transcriptional regulator AlpA
MTDRTPNVPSAEYLRTRQAAAYLNVSASYLKKLRQNGTGPEVIRISKRCVVYPLASIRLWISGHRQPSHV